MVMYSRGRCSSRPNTKIPMPAALISATKTRSRVARPLRSSAVRLDWSRLRARAVVSIRRVPDLPGPPRMASAARATPCALALAARTKKKSTLMSPVAPW